MLFSIILPVYNGAHVVWEAVESVLAQTEPNWELIVIDDGSADNTLEVLQSYAGNEKIHIISQPNCGVSAARNAGAKRATGEYIAFLDADDVWYPDHLAVMRDLIKKYPTAGLYGTFTKTELQNGGELVNCQFLRQEQDVLLEDFFLVYYNDKSAKLFTIITTCIAAGAFAKAGGFPEGCTIGEDLELSLRVAAYFPVALSGRCTAVYRKQNSTATKEASFDPDWGFFDRVETLYHDTAIPETKRENLRKLMQWFSMRRFRHYLIAGKRKKAWRVYRRTDKRWIGLKDRFINMGLLLLPAGAVRYIFLCRWKGKA